MSSTEGMPPIKERRILCPNIVQQLWPTIIHIKKLKQMPTLEKLQAHMFKKFHMTSNDCEKHVNSAVKDGLLIISKILIGDQNGREVTIYTAPENDLRDGHDWYCFECHRPGKVMECLNCWRVYHLYCTKEDFSDNNKDFICNVCQLLLKETERMIGQKLLTLNEMNQLLSYAYNRLIGKRSETFDLPNNEETDYKLSQLVYKRIDLSQILDKTKNNDYKKLVEFQIDCQDIVHCFSVLNGPNSVIASLAVQALQDCIHDLNEIRQCVDCYRMSNQKQDKSWFCKPCDPPHDLVFAKQKGFPYWPAKVIKIENGIYDVRFFGSFHERSFIEEDCVKPITSTFTQLRITKRTPPLNKALNELKKYQKIFEEMTNDSINDNSSSPLRNSLKRPRRRADGSRPRKRLAKIKEEESESFLNESDFDSNLNETNNTTPIVTNTRQRTSTPKVYVKSPMRTRNRGLKNPIESLETNGMITKSTRKYTKRSSARITSSTQTQEDLITEYFANAPELPATTANALVNSGLVLPEKLVKAKPRSNRLLNGIAIDLENEFSNSSYESDNTAKAQNVMNCMSEKNEGMSSLARSRPVRKSKPNSRYKSPEMEVKIPKKKYRQEKIVIKNEPFEGNTPSILQNKLNEYEFTDESQTFSPLNSSTNGKKLNQIKYKSTKKSLKTIKTSLPFIGKILSTESLSDDISTPIPITAKNHPKIRGRPKKVKNCSIISSIEHVIANSSQSPPKLSLSHDFSSSSGCNCEAKHKKQIKKLTESLEANHKIELSKLKKDLESVKKLNYRLQNHNTAITKEIEQLKAESHNYDKHQFNSLEQKHQKEISSMKKKQWCFNCEAEAIYFCCWNTSYCSTECQQQHWHSEHKRTCRRVKR